LRGDIQGRANDLNLANRIGFLAVYYNDPNLINTGYEKMAAVTADQVKQAAQKYLVPEHRSVMVTTPTGRPAGGRPGQQ